MGCHAFNLLFSTFMLLLAAATAAPGTKTATAAAAADGVTRQGPVCRLHLEGFGDRPGLKKAQLSCTGGSITAAASPELVKLLGAGPKGVVWSQAADCQDAIKEQTTGNCMLAVCRGSVATFLNPVVTGMKSSSSEGGTSLCITGGSKVALVNGTFVQALDMRPVRVHGTGTTVSIKQCMFRENSVTPSTRNGGALSVRDSAEVAIDSSSFIRNKAEFGGAIAADHNAMVKLTAGQGTGTGVSVFQDNSAVRFGGDINVWDRVRVHISHTEMQGGSAGYGAGSVNVAGANATVVLLHTRIVNATVKDGSGGAIALDEFAQLTAVNSTLQSCRASADGGGIDALGDATVMLVNTNLLDNMATGIGGGVSTWDRVELTLQNVTAQGNAANYGGAMVMSDNSTLVLVGTSRVQFNRAKNCGGGVFLKSDGFTADDVLATSATRLLVSTNNTSPDNPDVCLTTLNLAVVSSNSSLDNFVASLDSDGGVLYVTLNMSGPQGLPSDDPMSLAIYDENNKTVATQTLRGKSTGDGLMDVAVKVKQPPGDYRVEFGIVDDGGLAVAELYLRIVPCPLGYITASSGDACSLCVRGYFSFDPRDRECTMCVANAQCPGGAELWPADGFWHSAPRSDQMLRCINPSACVGAAVLSKMGATNTSGNVTLNDYKTAQCGPAYQGNLCGDCSEGYGKVRAFLCRKCMSRATIIMLYAAAALALIGLIKLLMYFHHSSNTTPRKSLTDPISDELLKVLVLHGQWLYIISNLVNVPWPVTLAVPLQILNGIWSSSNGSSIGFECIFPRNAIPLSIQRVLFCLFTPVAIMCAVLLIEVVVHRVGNLKHSSATHTRHKLASLVVAVVFLSLPTWVNTAFSLFTCMQLDRPASPPYQAAAVGRFWVADMQQQCYAGYHKAWAFGLGIPLLLLLCILLPGGVFMFMWRSRKHGLLTDVAFERHYGFMYHLWRDEVCWWEAVVVLQTISLVMVATFGFSLGSYYQGLVTGAVLGLIVMLLLWVRPFKCHAANTIAVQSACVLLLTSYTALTFLPYNSVEPGHIYGNIMGVVLLLLNVLFLARTVWKLAASIDWEAAREALRSSVEKGCGVKGCL